MQNSRKIIRFTSFQQVFNQQAVPGIASLLLVLLIVAGFTSHGAWWFESTMTKHMLIQLPLLIFLGILCFEPKGRFDAVLTRTDPHGAIAFILFSGWMFFWMLPLNLDLATIEPSVRLLKLMSVPVGLGCCVRWFWYKANTVFKCVLIFEIWASITRLGWLYIESPLQICSSYLIGEQQHVGTLLLAISAVGAIALICYAVFGSFMQNED